MTSQVKNEINYRRRQSLFKRGEIDWHTNKDLYYKYKNVIESSIIAQQIEHKSIKAWKSYFALLRLRAAKKKISSQTQTVKPPGYWKDRATGRRKLLILVLGNCYKFDANLLKLPKKLRVKWKGQPKWASWKRQGMLTLIYDQVKGKWYAKQTVEVEPLHQPLSDKRAYMDLGILNLMTVVVDEERQALAYSGRPALADWWYLSHRMSGLQSTAAKLNGRKTTRRTQILTRRRALRFKQYVNTAIRRAIEGLWQKGFQRSSSEISKAFEQPESDEKQA